MTSVPVQIGRYQILRRLGGGGMGSVFLARDPDLDRMVAIKLIKDDVSDDPELRERFAREARSAARLRHPNIVTIFDIGEHEGRPFIAMEHVSGESLADLIRRRDPMPVARKLKLLEMLCSGLNHAHRAGIIHRDTKPANLMIDVDGTLKIVDFGIARLADSSMTREGSWVGSLNYMSPEQIRGKAVDHRCDVFAVGAVAYELFTYIQAFPGGMSDGVFHRIAEEAPSPMAMLCPGLDLEIVRVIDHALEKDAAFRYQDLAAMARDCATIRERLAPDEPGAHTVSDMTSAATAMPGTPLPAPFTPRLTPNVPTAPPSWVPPSSGRPAATPDWQGTPAPCGTPLPRSTPGSHGRSTGADRLRRGELRMDAAHIALDRKEYDKAQELADQAAALDPTSQAIAALQREVQTAAAAAREQEQHRQGLDEALAAARTCLEQKDLNGARQHFDRATALAPADQRVQGFGIRLRRAETVAARPERPRDAEVRVEQRAGGSGGRTLLILVVVAVLAAIVGAFLFLR